MEMAKTTDLFNTLICKNLFPHTVELARRGKYREAEESIRFILNHDTSLEYFLFLGKVYVQQGRYEEAITEWKRVLERDPENSEARAAIFKAEELIESFLLPYLFKWRLITVVLGLFLVMSLSVSFTLWKGKADVFFQYRDSLKDKQILSIKYEEIEKEFEKARKEIDFSKIRNQELARKREEDKVNYQELAKEYEELEMKNGNQLVITLKGGHKLAQIKGLSDLEITIKQRDGDVSVYGEVPTEYLKGLIEKAIKGLEGVESVDVKGLKITHQYSISKGDALSKISEEIYGNHRKWMKIFKANKDKIKDPDILRPGDSLYIP